MVQSDFSFHLISARVRPPKIAILFNKDISNWQETCLLLMELVSEIWGGWYSCLIPTDGQKIDEPFWFLLKHFDPDYFYVFQGTIGDIKFWDKNKYDQLVDSEKRRIILEDPKIDNEAYLKEYFENVFVGTPREPFEVLETLENEISQRLNPFHYSSNFLKKFISHDFRPHYPLTASDAFYPHPCGNMEFTRVKEIQVEASAPFKLMVHAIRGKLYPKWTERPSLLIDTDNWTEENLTLNILSLWNEWTMGNFDNFECAASLKHCNFWSDSKLKNWKESSIVITGDSIQDFCFYYNLSRMKQHVYWLPQSFLTVQDTAFYKPLEREFISTLANHLYRDIHYNRPDSDITLFSISIPSDIQQIAPQLIADLQAEFQEFLNLRIKCEWEFDKLLTFPLRIYEGQSRGNIYCEQFYKGESVNFLNTPMPTSVKNLSTRKHRWITDILVENYRLPPIKDFGPKTISHPLYSSEEARVTKTGFSYFCPNVAIWGDNLQDNLIRPKLRLLEPTDIFETLFGAENYYISLSDKGNFHIESIEKFGTFEKLAEFLQNSQNQQILNMFLENKPSSEETGIYVQQRRYLSFSNFNGIFGDENQTGENLSNLIGKSILYRGFIFKCQHCKNAAWYSIENVTHKFVCNRCNHEQRYDKRHILSSHEPLWYYKLDEVIYQGYLHEMMVPVLTLKYLKSKSQSSFYYLPEIEIRSSLSQKKPEMELDICCCIDGKVIIGQCTKKDLLENTAVGENKRLNKNREISQAVKAEQFILSTSSDHWKDGTITRAQSIFSESRIQVQFLTKSEILYA